MGTQRCDFPLTDIVVLVRLPYKNSRSHSGVIAQDKSPYSGPAKAKCDLRAQRSTAPNRNRLVLEIRKWRAMITPNSHLRPIFPYRAPHDFSVRKYFDENLLKFFPKL